MQSNLWLRRLTASRKSFVTGCNAPGWLNNSCRVQRLSYECQNIALIRTHAGVRKESDKTGLYSMMSRRHLLEGAVGMFALGKPLRTRGAPVHQFPRDFVWGAST